LYIHLPFLSKIMKKFSIEANSPHLTSPHLVLRLLVLVFLLFGGRLVAQAPTDGCDPIQPCNKLSLKISLVRNELGTNCPPLIETICPDIDLTRQVIYKVQLERANTTINVDPFNLDYNLLDLSIFLESLQPTTMANSQINWTATKLCSAPLTDLLGSELLFSYEPDLKKIIYSLDDNTIGVCPPKPLVFEAIPSPGNPTASVATLFYVVVDVFPGEQFQLTKDVFTYNVSTPAGSQTCSNCNPNPSIPAIGAYNCDIAAPVSVPLPPETAQGTSLSKIRLLTTEAPSGTNGKLIHYQALYGAQGAFPPTYSPAYMTFATELNFSQPMLELSESSPVGATFVKTLIPLTNKVRYVVTVPMVTLTINDPKTVFTVKVNGPVIENLCWEVTATYDTLTARIKDDANACVYKLKVGQPAAYAVSTNCANGCGPTGLGHVACQLVVIPPTDCTTTPTIQFVLSTTDPMLPPILFKGFKIGFKSELDGTLAFTPVNPANPLCDALSGNCFQTTTINGGTYLYEFTNNTNLNLNLAAGPQIVATISMAGHGCMSLPKFYCIQLLDNGFNPCVPILLPTVVPAGASNIICNPRLYGRIVTENMEPIEGVQITLTPACSPNPTCTIAQAESNSIGQYNQCNFTQCSPCKTYLHTPKLDQDPKNGVSTYDLLLINRHILNLEPLGSPYKMIAADANLSHTITGFDIVELRKLILGVIPDFSACDLQDSWRFIPQDYVFPNPENPFESPESSEVCNLDSMPYPITWKGSATVPANFIGIKIGDVNLSAQTNQRPEALDSAPFEFEHTTDQQRGALLSIPIRYNGHDSLQACQMGIHFDPRQLKYRGVQAHDIVGVTQSNFGTTEAAAGSLRFVWLAPDLDRYRSVTHGAVVFDLLFEVVEDLNTSTDQPLIALDDQVLDNSAWNLQDKEYHLVSTETTPSAERASASSAAIVAVQCNPNPTSGLVTFSITPQQSTKVRIALFDQQGKMLEWKACSMEKGVTQTIEFTGLLSQPAGIYTWKVFNADFTEQGHILKR
jgi:Cohesin domain